VARQGWLQRAWPKKQPRLPPCPTASAGAWASYPWRNGLPCLDARQQLERILALDGAQIIAAEAPFRDALVHLRAIAEWKVRPVHDLRYRHHLEQCRDLTGGVPLREL